MAQNGIAAKARSITPRTNDTGPYLQCSCMRIYALRRVHLTIRSPCVGRPLGDHYTVVTRTNRTICIIRHRQGIATRMFSHCAFAFAKRRKSARPESRIDIGSFVSGMLKNVRWSVRRCTRTALPFSVWKVRLLVHESICRTRYGKRTDPESIVCYSLVLML